MVKNYSADDIKLSETFVPKEENKKLVLKEFGLEYNKKRPLFVLISRLVEQKGLDLIRAAENELQHMNADFVFL